MVKFTFSIHYNTIPGQIIRIIGSVEELGNWKEGIDMNYIENGLWKIEIDIPTNSFNYKFQVYNLSTQQIDKWEDCNDRLFVLMQQSDEVIVEDNWNNPDDTKITANKSKIKKSTVKRSTSTEYN